jgi:hypothetical protein
MAGEPRGLSQKSIVVLEQIAQGRTYEQILSRFPDLTYLDIFAAARETLTVSGEEREDYGARLARIKQKHSRAYEPWTEVEDTQLKRAIEVGTPVGRIAEQLQRQPSAIRSRLSKLALGEDAS